MNKKIVTFGEIMLRLATPDYLRFSQATSFEATYGGGEANVAVSLANFGMQAEFVSRIPSNDLSRACVMDLHKYGVQTTHMAYGGERLGIYFLETGAVNRPSKVIYDRAHSSIATIECGMIDWQAAFAGADWFHLTGITPALSQAAADVSLEAVKAASKMGLRVSIDLNYRKNLWKYGKSCSQVMPAIVEWCDTVIANEEDAEKVFGIKAEGFDVTHTEGKVEATHFESVAKELMARFPRVKKVAITLRGSINASHNTWGAVLFDGRQLYVSPRYDLSHIVDRVGGGDSFGAGLIFGQLTKPGDEQYALDFAVAASALKHTIKGDFNLVSPEEVERLAQGDSSGRVAR
ncbi:MAG: sugar kinase [Mucinivorans sp.]